KDILQEDFLNNRIYNDSISATKDKNNVSKTYFKEKIMKQIEKFSSFEMFNLSKHLIETIEINEFINRIY
ncbi:30045_t:CDS:1, partial [Gigaspora margarita]